MKFEKRATVFALLISAILLDLGCASTAHWNPNEALVYAFVDGPDPLTVVQGRQGRHYLQGRWVDRQHRTFVLWQAKPGIPFCLHGAMSHGISGDQFFLSRTERAPAAPCPKPES